MAMAKKGLRRIAVTGSKLVWRLTATPAVAVTVESASSPASRLILVLANWPRHELTDDPAPVKPSLVVQLVQFGMKRGWNATKKGNLKLLLDEATWTGMTSVSMG